jgi:membrane-associated HD superfamily phosphohydrolase
MGQRQKIKGTYMNIHKLNVWAILLAAVSAFLLGGIWYTPFAFRRLWKKANRFTSDPPAAGTKIFVTAFILSLVMAANLAMFLNDPKTNLAWGATAGFLAGFGWVAMGIGIVSLFERRPLSYVLVNGGYLTLALVIMGAIIGAWR